MSDLVTAPTVISVDPGGVTGWSVMSCHPDAMIDRDVPILMNIEHHQVGQIPTRGIEGGEEKCAAELVDLILAWPGAAVCIESFYIRQMSVDLSPVRITAMIRAGVFAEAAREEAPEIVVVEQQPAMAKTVATDDHLKKWGLYNFTVGQQHARDADRHSITLLRRALLDAPFRGELWPHLYAPNGKLLTGAGWAVD